MPPELDAGLQRSLDEYLKGPITRDQKERVNAAIDCYLDDEIQRPEFERRLSAAGFGGRGNGPPPRPNPQGQHNRAGNQPANMEPIRQELLTAAYRFVSFDPKLVVLAEEAALEPIDRPKPNGLCAEIAVEWRADGPLLIGDKEGGKTGSAFGPLKFGEDWVIPGSTLRGAIRSVAEIIGGARMSLAHVNHAEAFGLRDFTHKAYASSNESDGFPLGVAGKVKAGWLSVSFTSTNDALLKAHATIEPVADWFKTEVKQRTKGIELHKKYQWKRDGKSLTKVVRGVQVLCTRDHPCQFSEDGLKDQANIQPVKPDSGGAIKGHWVFSGAGPKKKNGTDEDTRWEYVFAAHKGTPPEPVAIDPALWERFVRLHSRTIGDKLRPQGTWETFVEMLKADRTMKIPVFYVGDLADQKPENFAFGLTRLFRAPHRWTLAQAMKASKVEDPMAEGGGKVDPEKLDMVDALFGYVYEPADGENATVEPASVARKGRVSFGMARATDFKGSVSDVVTTVEGAPRPSFAPYYLQGPVPDWSATDDGAPKIAGRKRYPVRGGDFSSVKEELERRAVGLKPRGEVTSQLKFLCPTPEAPLCFTSKVRLHNVTEAELGLVLSALTLDNRSHLRHAIGRAKNAGAGQVQAVVTGLAVHRNASAEPEPACDPSIYINYYVKAFEDYLIVRLGQDKEDKFDPIRKSFFACCDPAIGAANPLADHASTRPNGKFTAVGFKDLRDATKLARAGKPLGLPADRSLMDARNLRPARR